MKTRTIVVLSACAIFCFLCLIVCGLISSVLTSKLIAQKNAKIAVVIAKHSYPAGTVITDPQEMFESGKILQIEAPEGAVSDFEELRDRTLITDMRKGQPVQNAFLEFTRNASKSALIEDLQPGKRAMEIKTKARGGFILPGMHVDVIFSKSDKDPLVPAKTLLQNILVRAVERQLPANENEIELESFIVTLEVTPEEALILAPVKESGIITLILRPKGENDKVGLRKSGKVS